MWICTACSLRSKAVSSRQPNSQLHYILLLSAVCDYCLPTKWPHFEHYFVGKGLLLETDHSVTSYQDVFLPITAFIHRIKCILLRSEWHCETAVRSLKMFPIKLRLSQTQIVVVSFFCYSQQCWVLLCIWKLSHEIIFPEGVESLWTPNYRFGKLQLERSEEHTSELQSH